MTTENEELYLKDLFKEHLKWVAAKNLDTLNLSVEEYKKEIEKIYGVTDVEKEAIDGKG